MKIYFFWVTIVLIFTSAGCERESCKNDPEIYCEENQIYRCVALQPSFFSDGPDSHYMLAIDCSAYDAICQKGTPGYVPARSGQMQISHDFACVVPNYDCDEGVDTDCVNGAAISCNVSPGVAVITNAKEFEPGGPCD